MNEYVWVNPLQGTSNVPIGAHILGVFGTRIKIKDDDNNERWISSEDILRPMHPTSVIGVEDMIQLGELQEYSILRNLQLRYRKDLIYTYTGSILVTINPYKILPIYDRRKMQEYRKKRLGDLPPHIFAVADHSYESMRKKSEKRCIVISGESGAGKTESTKLLLQYFAHISKKRSVMEQQIIDSNPILEAFGNAKTICNDNSSRFGKYIAINFNSEGSVDNVQIKQYLLEKSRIVSQNKDEQNYHIFYAILTGMNAEEKRRLNLHGVTSYRYVNQVLQNNPPDDASKNFTLQNIKSAMKVLNFSESDIWNIFEQIAVILHFGNIIFETVSVSNVETVEIKSGQEIQHICKLLEVSKEDLTDSLIKKTIHTQSDNVAKLLSKQQAIDSRDAFVKRIYGNLFNFIVHKINKTLCKSDTTTNWFIGILDIFGFEAFDRNSFEQLCINYANERLQQFFIIHIFKSEQEQYAVENIQWKFIQYPDNQSILDLIEDGATSILSIINDETKVPQGTDEKLLDKLVKFHSEDETFLKPKYKHIKVFGIQHFAGSVLYDVKDFLEKNRDACSLDMKKLVQSCSNMFLKEIFASDFESDSNSGYKKRTETLVSKFKNSLDLLMHELNQCQPFFVRCIKPNEVKKPQKFDRMLCCKQLRYSGMTETTKVREAGYPVRYDYVEFVQRYRVLCPEIPLAHKTDCKEATIRICKSIFRSFPKADYRLGRTKIFLKYNEELILEKERADALYAYATTIQKLLRGWLQRKRYAKMKRAVLSMEENWIRKQKFLKGAPDYFKLHSLLNSTNFDLDFFQKVVTHLQAYCRGYLIRNQIKRKLEQKKFKSRVKEFREKDNSTTFQSFAQKHFQAKNDHLFSKKLLKNPLTPLVKNDDAVAAKILWITILRFTGNMPEPKKYEIKIPVRVQLREIFNRIEGSSSTDTNTVKKGTPSRDISRLYEDWLKTKTNDLEKLHFIVGHGIVRSELRDEIYCQICKTINKNPSPKATTHAWNLLSACTGCFLPSDLFLEHLKNFIRDGPKQFISYCLFRLHRTSQNGCRTQPPCYTEFHSIRQQKPFNLNVYLMNGTTVPAKIDAATTAEELLVIIAKNINLTDTFGFSVVLSQELKHQSLGDGSEFVLDAIAQCEQYALEIGETFEKIPWKLYLKKEMFAPWHDYVQDDVSANLICYQIAEGVKTGEYECKSRDLPRIIAQICYIDYKKLKPASLSSLINSYIPHYMFNLSPEDMEDFKEKVELVYQQLLERDRISINYLQKELMAYTRKNWSFQFSRFFHVFGSLCYLRSTNNSYPEVPLVVAVNSTGISVIDESNEKQVVAEMIYMEIQDITRRELTEGKGYVLKITTHTGLEISLVFQSNSEFNLHELLIRILETLKRYSKYVISIKNFQALDKSFLKLEKGDLIILSPNFNGKDLLHNSWAEGTNIRTGQTGHFLMECVEIIPTLDEPSDALVAAMSETAFYGRKSHMYQHVERLKHYNLEFYAKKFFREEDPKIRKETDQVSRDKASLWRYSREKLQQPLHANLLNHEKLSAEAVEAFEAILVYNKDRSSKEFGSDEQITNKIFNCALKNDALKDEIYCQIMKQLTANPDRESETKTWELMWMVTGLFKCSEVLSKEVKKFLQSRRTIQSARECLTRFYKISVSDSRKHTPHSIEIEAIKHKPCHILYKVYFPDETHKFFQINSHTKVQDLIEIILNRLRINITTNFNLFVHILGRVFALPKNYYIFDYFQLLAKWTAKKKISDENFSDQYNLYFMKQTWKDMAPGQNKFIDMMFLYPQEYNKYIEGYHEIPIDEIVKLAGLLYIIYSKIYKNFQQILPKLIPTKAYNLKKMESWQKEIKNNQSNLSEDDCKLEFLKYLYILSTYGVQHFVANSKSKTSNYVLYAITNNARSII